jgi:sulfatase maturation enzyme AslB (radical SAM superfamily)
MELTLRCQLQCEHCYTNSSPTAPTSSLSLAAQLEALASAAEAGVRMVQFIGGEPTLNSDLPRLIGRAVGLGLEVELYSNLYAITPRVWAALALPGVTLATSYYTPDPELHDTITTRRGSHRRTRANIAKAVQAGLALRVGIIEVDPRQDVDAAIEDLVALGVPAGAIKVDRTREVGRGSKSDQSCCADDALCGGCANGVVAVLADGTVKPCVFARDPQYTVGRLGTTGLAEVIRGTRLASERDRLSRVFASRTDVGKPCQPTNPGACQPTCGPSNKVSLDCSPSNPCAPVSSEPCLPNVGCAPDQSAVITACSPCNPNNTCSPATGDTCLPNCCQPAG